jgi:seryl-tRNA synthetase
MVDIKLIRENPELVKRSIKNRNLKIDIDKILSLDSDKRKILMEVEILKAERNRVSKQGKPTPEIIEQMKQVSQKINDLDKKVEEIDNNIYPLLLVIPNTPHESIPVGSPEANKVVKEWGEKRKFEFKPQNHIEIGEYLDILDFPRSSKISG